MRLVMDGEKGDKVLTAGNEGGYQAENIVGCLQADGQNGISDVGGGVLSEMAVDKGTEEDVDDADEGLGAQHSLPEIPWVTHLSEESNEEKGTTVGVNHGVDTVELTGKAIGLLLVRIWWGTSECLDGLNDVDERRLGDDLVVRSPVGNCDHDHDEADNVQPHRRISQPTQALQRSDHSQNHTDHHEDDHAGDEADALAGQLSNGLSTCKNQHGHSHELLERLGDVDEVT